MRVTVAPDYRVFVLFLALNAHGYDLEGDPQMHPVRLALRQAVAGLGDAPPEETAWFELTKPAWPRVSLCETYVLHQDSWPAVPDPVVAPAVAASSRFGAGAGEGFAAWLVDQVLEMPGPAPADLLARMGELGPLLEGFARRVDAPALWKRFLPEHQAGAAAMGGAVASLLRRAGDLLRVDTWPFDSIRAVPNLLQSRWLADQTQIGSTLWAVVASAGPELVGGVVHEAVHMVVRPPLRRLLPEIGSLAGGAGKLRELMEPIGYWGSSPEAGAWFGRWDSGSRIGGCTGGNLRTPSNRTTLEPTGQLAC